MSEPNSPDPASQVLLSVEESVAVVTLNQPDRLNAISRSMAARLVSILHRLRDDDAVKAVVLTGAGKAFCAGAQLDALGRAITRTQRKQPMGDFAAVTRAIVDVDKPVIAAITGVAVGAGLSYALAADRRIADPTARLSAIFVKRGMAPDCGMSFLLPRIVGLSNALHLVTTGAMVGADEALHMGLVDEIAEPGGALERALTYARELATGPSAAVELARRAVYQALESSLDQALDFEAWVSSVVHTTTDSVEGRTSFMERRPARFTGT
jgi:2-(1,2-epoxy-1,2-dihydrophenyl)acetyl-CoA isomerase